MPTLNYPDPELADSKVRLRQWRLTDLSCIEAAAEDPSIPPGTTVPPVFTPEAGRAFIHRQRGRLRESAVSLAISAAATDQAVGLAILSLRPQAGVGGIGYWIIPPARGQGYATSAARLLGQWGLEALGLQRVEAWVMPGNERSQRALLAAGFELEGLLRSFLQVDGQPKDALVFSRIGRRVTPSRSPRAASRSARAT